MTKTFIIHPFTVEEVKSDPAALPLLKTYSDFVSFSDITLEPLDILKTLSDGPPRPRQAFPIPPRTPWVYILQKRIWLKFMDGREEWSDWTDVHTPHFVRKHAAERAMKGLSDRFNEFNGCTGLKREVRVWRVPHPTGEPHRRRR